MADDSKPATFTVREQLNAIKQRFTSWVLSDPDRTEWLVRLYNVAYKELRPRRFGGSRLDFPGMRKAITLKPQQKDAVWRTMTNGNTLLAHRAGAGKVCTAVAELKARGVCGTALLERCESEASECRKEALEIAARVGAVGQIPGECREDESNDDAAKEGPDGE